MAKREKTSRNLTDRKLLIFLGLVAGFTILGPFGTYEFLTLWERLIFWTVLITGIGFFMHIGITLILDGATFQRVPRPARICIGACIAALPSVALVMFFAIYFFPTPMEPDSFPMLWAQVALIGSVAGLVEYRLPPKAREAQDEPILTRLHRRLPEGEAHDIVSLTVRDHYVEVTTTTGRHMLLMRLTDAMEELDALSGVRLHRSHWAASAHIETLAKRGAKQVAVLSDARELPVSKSYADAVAAVVATPRASGAARGG